MFKWLFKNKKNENSKDMKDLASDRAFINITQDIDGTPVYEDSFYAGIIIDKFDNVKWMINEDKNFRELYPEQDPMFNFEVSGKDNKEKIKSCDTVIDKHKKKLAELIKNPDRKYNETDIELEIRKYEIKKIILSQDNKGSPLFVAKGGVKNFFFERNSGEYVPLRWNMKGKSIYRDIAYKKRYFAMAQNNLMAKYGAKLKKAFDAALLWGIIINIVWTIAVLIGTFVLIGKYHNFETMYDDSKINELRVKAERAVTLCSDEIARSSVQLTEITNAQANVVEKQNEFLDRLIGKNTEPQELPNE